MDEDFSMASSSLDPECNRQPWDDERGRLLPNPENHQPGGSIRHRSSFNNGKNNSGRPQPRTAVPETAPTAATTLSSASPTTQLSLARRLTRSQTWANIYSQSSTYAYHSTKRVIAYGINVYVLLLFLPLGILGGSLGWNSVLVSVFNFLAIIPLSALVSASSDNLAEYFDDLVGTLINATFGNSVELSAGILSLIHGDIVIAQSVMIGSILSDILLVLGACLIYASFDKDILRFNKTVAETLSSLMIIAAVALILPTALYSTFTSDASEMADKIVAFSRGTALILLLLYLGYLYFQMKTHKHLFLQPQQDNEPNQNGNLQDASASRHVQASSLCLPIVALVLSAIGMIVCTHFLLDSLDSTSTATHISKSFIATILIPVASNSPEGAAVIAVSRSGNVDFAISIIVGSILQISLFAIPLLVVLGWIIQQQMTLNFETFHTVILFFSVLVVNHLLREGNYTYMHGTMLVGFYAILATSFYFR